MRTTTALTLGQAAKAADRSKTAVLRAIQNGRLSAEKDETGQYAIEPAELFRVFTPVPDTVPVTVTAVGTAGNPQVTTLTASEISRLQTELKAKDERIAALEEERERERRDKDAMITDLRQERDRLLQVMEEQAGTVKLLTYQSRKEPPAPPRQRGFLDWLLNREPR